MRLPAFAALAAVTLTCASAARATENDATVPTYHADAALRENQFRKRRRQL